MDIASLIGLILCFVLVLYGIITGESIAGVKYFLDVPSALITFGGAIGATMASVSMCIVPMLVMTTTSGWAMDVR